MRSQQLSNSQRQLLPADTVVNEHESHTVITTAGYEDAFKATGVLMSLPDPPSYGFLYCEARSCLISKAQTPMYLDPLTH